jgi:hypothetical protein
LGRIERVNLWAIGIVVLVILGAGIVARAQTAELPYVAALPEAPQAQVAALSAFVLYVFDQATPDTSPGCVIDLRFSSDLGGAKGRPSSRLSLDRSGDLTSSETAAPAGSGLAMKP